jgi:hypothetical protein
MGQRFLSFRYPLGEYSGRRAFLRLNEGDFEPHQMRPYGFASGNFFYRQMFEKKHQSRQGNVAQKRAVKKAARQQARCELSSESWPGEW